MRQDRLRACLHLPTFYTPGDALALIQKGRRKAEI